MSKLKLITILINYWKSKHKTTAPAMVSIEITSELYENCARFNVTPERAINDFVANICSKEPGTTSISIHDYMSRAYGNMRIVNSLFVKQQRAAVQI